MQLRTLITICLLTIFAIALIPGKARATHAAGGEILYEWLADSTYKVIFKFYRDCRGISEPIAAQLCYKNTCTNQVYSSVMTKAGSLPDGSPNGSPVSVGCSEYPNSCLNASSAVPGYEEWLYLDTVTLPSKCSNWKFYTFISARNPSNNLGPAVFYVEAMLNNEIAQGNTSAYFSVKPVPYVSINKPYTFNNGAVDNDNDSLVFSVLMPQQMTSASCDINSINCVLLSKTPALQLPSNPFQTNNTFSLNAATGALSFTPAEQGPQTVTIQAKEYRNGVLIGAVMRDIQVQVLSYENVPPTVEPQISTFVNAAWVNNRVEACASAPFSFCFDARSLDPEAILKVTDNHVAVMKGSTISYTNQLSDSVRGYFSWTPSASDTGLKLLVITILDTTCAPPGILFTQSFTLPVYLWPGTRMTPEAFFDLPPEACIGQELTVEASKKGLMQYIWSTDPATIVAGKDERYTLKWNCAGKYIISLSTIPMAGCLTLPYSDTIEIREYPHAEILSLTQNNVCIGDTVSVKALTMQSYSYQWQPAENIVDPRAPETVVRVNGNMTLVMTVKDDIGCEAVDSINITGKPCCNVALPNAFTPNGDGINDQFRTINATHSEVQTFIVLNRFGEIIFRTNNMSKGWDGSFAGVPLDAGTYYYYLKYKCIDNNIYERKGDVILIR